MPQQAWSHYSVKQIGLEYQQQNILNPKAAWHLNNTLKDTFVIHFQNPQKHIFLQHLQFCPLFLGKDETTVVKHARMNLSAPGLVSFQNRHWKYWKDLHKFSSTTSLYRVQYERFSLPLWALVFTIMLKGHCANQQQLWPQFWSSIILQLKTLFRFNMVLVIPWKQGFSGHGFERSK